MECYGIAACGHLSDDDVLVLPLDVTDIASHSSATDTVLKTFGQVLLSPIIQHYPFVFSQLRILLSL